MTNSEYIRNAIQKMNDRQLANLFTPFTLGCPIDILNAQSRWVARTHASIYDLWKGDNRESMTIGMEQFLADVYNPEDWKED